MRYWTLGGEGELVLTFPPPAPPLSINQANTMHWAAKRSRLAPWRDIANVVTRQARAAVRPGPGQPDWRCPFFPVTIHLALQFREVRTRDPHNYVGTVVKAVVDGVKLGGLIPDDSQEWATVLEPTIAIQPDKARPLVAVVTIKPRS